MDNIFFEGLKVGRIIEVTSLPDMKIATVKPYVNVLKKKYFYAYKNVAQEVKPPETTEKLETTEKKENTQNPKK